MKGRRIELLRAADLPAFREFLERHWQPGHALTRSPALLDWMYRDAREDSYHFVVSRDERDGSLEAILGFLPLDHFDSSLSARDLWLQLWKVRDDRRGEGLGTALFEFLKGQRQPRSICGFGLSEGVKRTYARLGFRLGTLNHFFLADPRRSRFQLLANWSPTPISPPPSPIRFVPLDAEGWADWAPRFDWSLGGQRVPAKSPEYFRRRFFTHPIYRYEVFALVAAERPRAFVFLRRAGHEGAHALKWVDFHGDFRALVGSAGAWLELLARYDAEYVELHNLGLPAEILRAAGFEQRLPDSAVIVPAYFEPFERRSIDISYAHWTGADEPYFIFKGDSDQDRPSLV